MGATNGKFGTKRIGYAVANSIWGPWERCEKPLLMPGNTGEWDDYITTNPAFKNIRTENTGFIINLVMKMNM